MYGEPSVEGSQTIAERLELLSERSVPSDAAGCSEAHRLTVTRKSPANMVADWIKEPLAIYLFMFILISLIHPFRMAR
jgi:hypothetical protein